MTFLTYLMWVELALPMTAVLLLFVIALSE